MGAGVGRGGRRYLLLAGGILEALVKVLGSLWGVLGMAVLAAKLYALSSPLVSWTELEDWLLYISCWLACIGCWWAC